MSITYARFNGFLRNVPTVFKTYEKRYTRFPQKNFPKDILFPKFVIDTIN